MTKETVANGKSAKPANMHKAASNISKHASTTVESLLPTGSPQRTAVGMAAAAGGALFAAATFGVGPAALAGTAGYLAYRGSRGSEKAIKDGLAQKKH
jgi:hypothetical protein